MPMQKQWPCWSADQVQGICRHQGLQWTCWFGCQVPKAVATAIRNFIILAKLSSSSCDEGTQWKIRLASPTQSIARWLAVMWLCAGVPHLAPQGHGHHLSPCAQEAPDDCYTSASCTTTLAFSPRLLLMPFPRPTVISPLDLWKETVFTKFGWSGIHWPSCKDPHQKVSMQRTQASPAVATYIILY